MNKSLELVLKKIAEKEGLNTEVLLAEAEKSMTTKANNIVGSNTGWGAELRNTMMYADPLYDLVVQGNSLLQSLPWNQGQISGTDMVRVPVVGSVGYFSKGTELWSSATIGWAQSATNKLATAKVDLYFKKYTAKFIISREEIQRAIWGEAALYNKLQAKIVESFSNTINSHLVNGDAGSTSTLNNVTDAPTWALDFRSEVDGIRKTGATNWLKGWNVAFTRWIFKQMLGGLGEYAAMSSDIMFVTNSDFANVVRFDPAYSTADVFGANATNGKPWFVGKPEWIDMFVTREYPYGLDATGNIPANPVNGTCAGVSLIYKPAVQYAFGSDLKIIATETADGYLFDVVGFFAFNIVNNIVAWVGKTVATAVCVA